jgi:hypothetical protein
MTVITDNETMEKILVFGGITNRVGPDNDPNNVQSFLSNQTYICTVAQRSQGLKFRDQGN